MRIAFVGHLCRDVNVVRGETHTFYGGGVFHGSITAKRLGAEAVVYTKCASADRSCFGAIEEAGVEVIFLASPTTTSIRNDYPTTNPDDRRSTLLSRAEPFTIREIEAIEADWVHVNPLWFGEFPIALLPVVRRRANSLSADAQGFLRRALPDGRLMLSAWQDQGRCLPMFDLFKADAGEARLLTGCDDVRLASQKLRDLGVRTVLLTHQGGVCVQDESGTFESKFAGGTLEGRTGRGDTCTAAYLVARSRIDTGQAAAFAAAITSEKMQYLGPYRGISRARTGA